MAKTQKKYKIYKKPPIIEAVVEIRFADSITDGQLEQLVNKQKKKFNIQKIEEIELKISDPKNDSSNAETRRRIYGYKLISNSNTSEIVQCTGQSIAISRLPPYEGWENLLNTLKPNLSWYTNKKFRPLSRIGVRYINRIDIPADEKIEIEDYFKIFPHVPQTKFPDINRFSVQTVSEIDKNMQLTINMHSVHSPLLKHHSIKFDLDVAQSTNLPKNEKDLYKLLDDFRDKKNLFFETLLTPKCKRLFNK